MTSAMLYPRPTAPVGLCGTYCADGYVHMYRDEWIPGMHTGVHTSMHTGKLNTVGFRSAVNYGSYTYATDTSYGSQ